MATNPTVPTRPIAAILPQADGEPEAGPPLRRQIEAARDKLLATAQRLAALAKILDKAIARIDGPAPPLSVADRHTLAQLGIEPDAQSTKENANGRG
jgi:hypothetical protein